MRIIELHTNVTIVQKKLPTFKFCDDSIFAGSKKKTIDKFYFSHITYKNNFLNEE